MVYKCKMCGGELILSNESSIAQCEYCGSVQTVPTADNEKKIALFTRANKLRFNCEFDKAAGVYEAIVADYPEEAEAYWGLVLCKYGIEYVDDPSSGKKVPTCHRSSFESIMDDSDFELTLENADVAARKVYREEAKQIEELRKGILEVASKTDPYDVFICYKETNDEGTRTLDSVLAQDLYDVLVDKGYKVFFSRISLEDKLGQEYEPYIFSALNSAKVMLVIGTDYEYFNAVWVRNEWSRYLKLMANDHSKHLIPCYKGIDAYDMPKEFTKLQAQDLDKVGAIQDILRGIDKLITPNEQGGSAPKGAEVGPLLAVGDEALQNGEWSIALSRYDLALTVDPKCADAYVGKLMAECKCKKREELGQCPKRFDKNNHYKQAILYGDDELKRELEEYCKKAASRYRKHNIRLMIVASLIVITIISVLEISYRNIINDYYSQTITAESAVEKLSWLSWYREPDESTQCLLEEDVPGAYPQVERLDEIIIPGCVKSIGPKAFYANKMVTRVIIPDSVENIASGAFQRSGLAFVDISAEVIENGAFRGNDYLRKIILSDDIVSIGEKAFVGCPIVEVWYEGSEKDREKIEISAGNDTLLDATWHYNFKK